MRNTTQFKKETLIQQKSTNSPILSYQLFVVSQALLSEGGYLFPDFSNDCIEDIQLTDFQVDQNGTFLLTGSYQPSDSCSKIQSKPQTFVALFDSEGASSIFKQTPLVQKTFQNPLLKSEFLFFTYQRGNHTLSLMRMGKSYPNLVLETSFIFLRKSDYFATKSLVNIYCQLESDLKGNLNALSISLSQGSLKQHYVYIFDDTYYTQKLFKFDENILSIQSWTGAKILDSSIMINLQYSQNHNSKIFQGVLDFQIFSQTNQFTSSWQWKHKSEEKIQNRQLQCSSFDSTQWYLIHSIAIKSKNMVNVVSGRDKSNKSEVQILQLSIDLHNLKFDEYQEEKLLIFGNTPLSEANQIGFMVFILDLQKQSLMKSRVLTANSQNSIQIGNLLQSRYGFNSQYLAFQIHTNGISSSNLNYQRIYISKNTKQDLSNLAKLQMEDELVAEVNKDQLDFTHTRNLSYFGIAQDIETRQDNVNLFENIENFSLNAQFIPQMNFQPVEIEQQEDSQTTKTTQRMLLDPNGYKLTVNSVTNKIIFISIDSTTILTSPQTYDLVLKNSSLNVETISSISWGNDTAIPSDRITLVGQQLRFTLTTTQLKDWSGTRTLNVKILDGGVDVTVAYIQVTFLIPDAEKILDWNTAINPAGTCRSNTQNPFYFGDTAGVFKNIKGRYLHVDTRANFYIAGESDSLPFHDQSSTAMAGFFAFFSTSGQAIWILRIQEDQPAASVQYSSCYLLAEQASLFVYAICSVTIILQRLKLYLMSIYDSGTTFTVTFLNTYIDPTATAKKFLDIAFRAQKILSGQTIAEAHQVLIQKQSGSISHYYDVKSDGTIARGMSFNGIQASVPCYGAVQYDSQFYYPCFITAYSSAANQAKVHIYQISSTFTTMTSGNFHKGIIIEAANTHDFTLGSVVSHVTAVSQVATPNQDLYFYATTQTHFVMYPINSNNMLNNTLAGWQFTNSIPGSQFTLMKTLSNQAQGFRRFWAATGTQSPTSKQSIILFMNVSNNCYSFGGYNILGTPVTPTFTQTTTTIKILTSVDYLTSVQASDPIDKMKYVGLHKLTTQTFSSQESEKWNWGQGSLPNFLSGNVATRQCGSYDYSPDMQEVSVINIPQSSTPIEVTNTMRIMSQCANRPLDMFVFSSNLTRPMGPPNYSFAQSYISFDEQTRKIKVAPPINNIPESFYINVTLVDRYDGRIQNENPILIRINKDNPTDFQTQSYFECPTTLFPFSYGESCTSNCGLSPRGIYYDQSSNNLMIMGAVQSGFSKLIDKTKGDFTDAYIMKTNAFGIVLWMNQYRSQNQQNEAAYSAVVYNDTYVIVSVQTEDSNINNYANQKQVFARFLYSTGQYNGTMTFTKTILSQGTNYLESCNQLYYRYHQFGNQQTQHRISANCLFRYNQTYASPGIIWFSPFGQTNPIFTYYLNIAITITQQNVLGDSVQQGNDIYYATVYDAQNLQFLNVLKGNMSANGSSGISPFYNSTGAGSSHAKFQLSTISTSTAKTLRPPQIIEPVNGILVIFAMINSLMRVFEINSIDIYNVKEYNITFSSSRTIAEFQMVRTSYSSQYAFLANEKDTSTGQNIDGLLIVIFDDAYNVVTTRRTGIKITTIKNQFVAQRLNSDNGIYYIYGVSNYAFDNENGAETLVGYLNLANNEYDSFECQTYGSATSPVSIAVISSPLVARLSSSMTTIGNLAITDLFTPFNWQMQFGDDRIIMPKRKKANSLSSITQKSTCQTQVDDAVSSPLSQIFSPQVGKILQATTTTKTTSDLTTYTKNCQGIPITTTIDTSVDSNWANQNEFMQLQSTSLTLDLTKDQPTPGIREVILQQCLTSYSSQCNSQYVPLAIQPSDSQTPPTDVSYNCELANEFPKVLGDEFTDFKLYDSDLYYQSSDTTTFMVACGQKAYSNMQDREYQTLQDDGFIIYYKITGAIVWAYSASNVKVSSSTQDYSFFQSCRVTTDSTPSTYVVSLIYSNVNQKLTLLKQRISDGVYIYAHELPNTYPDSRSNGMFVDATNQDFYVYTSQAASANSVHNLMKISQQTRGFQVKWDYQVTSTATDNKVYGIDSITKFQSRIFYIAQIQDATNYFSTLQSLSIYEGSKSNSRYFSSDSYVYSSSVTSDLTQMYVSTISISGSSYNKRLRIYDTDIAYVTGKEYSITKTGDGAKISLVVTDNYIIDGFYQLDNQQINIVLIKKSDLTLLFSKMFAISGMDLQFLKMSSIADQQDIYFTFIAKKMLNDDKYSGVIHKLDYQLNSANSCFTTTTVTITLSDLASQSTSTISPTPTFTTTLQTIRLLPASTLYLESKIDLRDVKFRLAKKQNCQPYGISFFDELDIISVTLGQTKTISIPQPNICSGDTLTITQSVDTFLTIPSFLDIKVNTSPMTVKASPTSTSEIGQYSVRQTYKLNLVVAYRIITINVDPSDTTVYPIGSYAPLTCPAGPVLFHLHKEGPNYFIASDMTSDLEQYVICGHRIQFYQQAFFQVYDKSQIFMFQMNLNSGKYDGYYVDCRYDATDNLFSMINSVTNAERSEGSIYLYKHTVAGFFINTKQIVQTGQSILGDGFRITDSLMIYGRSKGLLTYTIVTPFVMKLTANLEVLIFKSINYQIDSQIQAITLNGDTLYGLMGTKDPSYDSNKNWVLLSLDAKSFYEKWAFVLKDSSKISAGDYEDYASPDLAFIQGSLFTCVYYQYSYTATTYYEAALVRQSPTTGVEQKKLEWQFSSPFQSCSITENYIDTSSSQIILELSTFTKAYFYLLTVPSTTTNSITRVHDTMYTLNFGQFYNIKQKPKFDTANGRIYIFSSFYYVTEKLNQIGRQFLTYLQKDTNNVFLWEKPCPSSDLQSQEDVTFITSTLNEGDGVTDYTQTGKWVSFNMESKMISNVYIDTFFHFNSNNLQTGVISSQSSDFIDYRSNYETSGSICRPYAKPTEPTGKTDYLGTQDEASSNPGYRVKLGKYIVNLEKFTQCQGYAITHQLKGPLDSDGEYTALPDIFTYIPDTHQLVIVANSNNDVDTYDLIMVSSLVLAPTITSEITFQVEILENRVPTFKSATSTSSSITFDEWLDYEITVDLDTDPEDDDAKIVGAELQDSTGAVIDMPWFTITKMTDTNIKLKLVGPRILADTDVKVVVKASDSFNLFTPATYTIQVGIDNQNHKPYFSGDDDDTVLEGWTVNLSPSAAEMPKIQASLFSDHDEEDSLKVKFNQAQNAKCVIDPDSYLEIAESTGDVDFQQVAIKTSVTESNDYAGTYKITCTESFVPIISQKINIHGATATEYTVKVTEGGADLIYTGACSDPENDDITYTIEFNQEIVDSDPAAVRRNLVDFDPYVASDMATLVSFDRTNKKIKIDDAIRDKGLNTYQFLLTCQDKTFNEDSKVSYPFRIVVYDSDLSPTAFPQDPVFKFFKKDELVITYNTSRFTDDGSLTYSIVGDIDDSDLEDLNGDTLTVDACDQTAKTCKISGFTFETQDDANTYTNSYFTASQKSLTAYVKAVDVGSQAVYSEITIFFTPCNGDCADCDDTDANTCTMCADGDFLKTDDTCGACPADQYGNDSGVCADCMDQCLSCTGSGNNIIDDGCVCDVDNDNFIQIDSNNCLTVCPDGYRDDGSFCYRNVQPEIISFAGTTHAITFDQLKDGVYDFLIKDQDGDVPSIEYVVKFNNVAITDQTKPLAIPDTQSTEAPYKYSIVFTADDFTNTIAADTTASNGYKYDIVLTVDDTDKSTLPEKTYTIRVIIILVGKNTPKLKQGYSTKFDTIFIGQSFKHDVLITQFEDDIGDRLSLNCTKGPATGVPDNNWIDIIDFGQYQFPCDITDGVHTNHYTFTLDVIENKQIVVTSLSPMNQTQNLYTVKTYDLHDLCVDPENQSITRILTINGTAYLEQVFGTFLQWDNSTGKLTFIFNSNSQSNLYKFILYCLDGVNPAVSTEFSINAIANYPLIANRAIENQIIKFTQTALTINITGLFTDPENQTYSTQIYGRIKSTLPVFIKGYSNGILSVIAISSQAGDYKVEIVGKDSFNQETTVPFNITLQGCYSNCQTCFEVGSKQCNSCKTSFYFYLNECLSVCPDGTYQDQVNKVCVPCPSSCKTCLHPTDDGDNQCLTCLPNFFSYQMDCLTTCPADYYGDTVTNTCKLIENSGTPTTNLEYTDCKEFLKLFTMVTDTRGVSSFTDILSETVSCAKMKKCANGQTNQPACTWNRQFAMQCSISPKSSKVTLRVATNSMPDHCFDSSVIFAQENNIDFEVRFNVKTSSLSKTSISTTTSALSYQCSSQWVDDSQLPAIYEYKSYSGTTQRVVGITLNGIPLFQGTSELQYDAFFPKSYGLYRFPKTIDVDLCLGSSQYSSFYHYYSYSPCIIGAAFKTNAKSALCQNVTTCKNDLTTYMQSGLTPEYKSVQQVIGVAKDGHKILGPFKKGGVLWQPCDVDICNGVTQNGEYFYVLTLFHPYTINCWGPSVTANSYRAQCSSNSYVCGETPPYSTGGGSGTSSAQSQFQIYFNMSYILVLMISLMFYSII
eukprot:403341427